MERSYNLKRVERVFFIPFMLLFLLTSSVYSSPRFEPPAPAPHKWGEVENNLVTPAPIDTYSLAIESAKNGQGSGLEGIPKEHDIVQGKTQLAEAKPGADKGSVWLEYFHRHVQELKAVEDQIKKKGRNCIERIKVNREFVSSTQEDSIIIENIHVGKRHCYEAGRLRKEISGIQVAVENDAALVDSKVKSAQGRAEICHTEADEDLIKLSHQDARDTISGIKKNLDVARHNLATMKAELEKIDHINALLASMYDKKKWRDMQSEYERHLKETDECIYALKITIPQSINELRTRVRELKGRIVDKRQLYGGGAVSRADFDSLLAEVNQIRPVQPISRYKLHAIKKKHQQARSRKPAADPPSIRCFTVKDSEVALSRAEELFYRASRALGGNDNLLAMCKEQLPSLSPATGISAHENTGGSTQGSTNIGADNRSFDRQPAQGSDTPGEPQAERQQQNLENWMAMMDMLAGGAGDIQGVDKLSGGIPGLTDGIGNADESQADLTDKLSRFAGVVREVQGGTSQNTDVGQEKWMDVLNKFAGMAGDIQGVDKPSGGIAGPTDGFGSIDESQADLMERLTRFAGVMREAQGGASQNTDGGQEKWMDVLNQFAGMAGDIQGIERPFGAGTGGSPADRQGNRPAFGNGSAGSGQNRYSQAHCPVNNPGTAHVYWIDSNNDPDDETRLDCRYYNGKLVHEGPYVNGKRHGAESQYHNKNWGLSSLVVWRNGLVTLVKKYTEDGDIWSCLKYDTNGRGTECNKNINGVYE